MQELESSSANKTLIVVSTSDESDHINARAVDLWRLNPSLPRMDGRTFEEIASDLESRLGLRKRGSVVPFLPLGRDTVRRCVDRSLALNHGLVLSKFESRRAADKVMEDLQFFSPDLPVFSASGCKKIDAKVDIMLYDDDQSSRWT